jgi:hypothetical protein
MGKKLFYRRELGLVFIRRLIFSPIGKNIVVPTMVVHYSLIMLTWLPRREVGESEVI